MGDDPNQRGLSRKHIRHAIEDTLRRLGTDYVDLYQIHRFDPNTPVEETMEALDDLVREGKVLYLGASSMFAWQLAKMIHASQDGLRPVCHHAEPLQPPLPRGGARDDPLLPRTRRSGYFRGARWRAGPWPGPRRRPPSAPARTTMRGTSTETRSRSPTRRSSMRSTGSPGSAGCPPRRWRSRGSCRNPVSSRRSWGPRSRTSSRTRWRPSRWS